MPTATINGIDLSYADTGGDGPAIVLSHGFLMDRSMFDPQVAALEQRWRVITWDQRAHGGTPAPGPFSYWDSAADLLGLLDHLGIGSAVLGGMSQGGFISMRAALLASGRVRALVLFDSQAGTEDPAAAPAYERMHEIWREAGPGPVQEVIAAIILGDSPPQAWYAKWADWAQGDRDGFTHAFRALMDRDDLTARLGEITCPALILHGTADAAIPVARAEQLRDRLGGPARLVLVEGGSHAANLTHPDPVNAEMLGFLASLDA